MSQNANFINLYGALLGFPAINFAKLERNWAKKHCAACEKPLAHEGRPGRTCPECRAKPPKPENCIVIDLTLD